MGIFRSNAVDLIVKHLPEDRGRFGTYREDDRIASLFFSVAFELIARTAYTMRKATPEGKMELANSVSEFFPVDDVNVQTMLRAFIDEEKPEETILENYLFLDMLRGKYLSLVRGRDRSCWGKLDEALRGEDKRCPDSDSCQGESATVEEIQHCESYQEAWRKTGLAVDVADLRELSPRELQLRIHETCPALRLVTDPLEMEAFLSSEVFGRGERDPGGRSVRGLVVRILTDFVEFCLDDLNHHLQLPEAKKYRFLT